MNEDADRKQLLSKVKRIVVKVGSNVLTGGGRELHSSSVGRLAGQVHELRRRDYEVVLVSSGAIASGLTLLDSEERPNTLPELQAVAAIGQSHLVSMYDRCFKRHGYHAAQVLLTYDDLEDRTRYLNVRNTLRALLKAGAVPIINENDTVSIDEIKFGDNDVLSAFVAHLLPADLLVLLTVVDGLLDEAGAVVPSVTKVDDDVLALADGDTSSGGTGGMTTKLRAAKYATEAGQACIIANGCKRNVLERIIEGESIGTVFRTVGERIRGRKRWLGFVRRPKGTLTIDDGARKALRHHGKSLLATGVREVAGNFNKGDVVAVVGTDGKIFAQGMVNYSSGQLDRVKGLRTPRIRKIFGEIFYEEVIHRDNMVITDQRC